MAKKEEEEYVTITLEDLTEAQAEIVNVVIHEGELRERERIIALIKKQPGMTKDQMINGDHLIFEIERSGRE